MKSKTINCSDLNNLILDEMIKQSRETFKKEAEYFRQVFAEHFGFEASKADIIDVTRETPAPEIGVVECYSLRYRGEPFLFINVGGLEFTIDHNGDYIVTQKTNFQKV